MSTVPVPRTPDNAGSPFDALRRERSDGSEYWSARELQPHMGYARWENLTAPMARAILAAQNTGYDVASHFLRSQEVSASGPSRGDVHLSRDAAYLLAMNGDPNKPEIAAAQAYFVGRIRQAERLAEQAMPFQIPQTYAAALELAALQARELEDTRHQVATLQPRAEGYDAWVATGVTVEIGAAAKVLASFGVKVGRTRLYRDLRAQGWVFQNSTEPMQGAVEAGWVVVEFGKAYKHPKTGETVAGGPRTRLTPKGLERLLSGHYGVTVTDAFRSAVAAAGEA